jgi:hypothetical protein
MNEYVYVIALITCYPNEISSEPIKTGIRLREGKAYLATKIRIGSYAINAWLFGPQEVRELSNVERLVRGLI